LSHWRIELHYFDPPPDVAAPERFPSPFAHEPHPLARRAALELAARIGHRPALHAAGGGKMFGVLVVADAHGRLGYLSAFSGMLDGAWIVDGFVGPAYDVDARAAFWPAGEAGLGELADRRAALDRLAAPLRAELAVTRQRHATELAELRALHLARRSERRAARAVLEAPPDLASAARDPSTVTDARKGAAHALDQASRGDTAERRRMDEAHAAEVAGLAAKVAELEREIAELDERRAERSRELLVRIQDGYVFADATGERRTLRDLFAPAEPPGGAGDCAGPKLIAHAYRVGLVPLALAEIWLGATPATGGRRDGQLYPACRGKCGPILEHALRGLGADEAPLPGTLPYGDDEPRVVHEDAWIVVVDKPYGMLTVPGRSGRLRDSALVRMRRRFAEIDVVHRLDLDTSGLLVLARDAATRGALQRAFEQRDVDKRYVAIVDGVVAGEAGTIELPLRVDLDDRPRQIVDPVHGLHAVTAWRVISRDGGRTRLELRPLTGRTHQLRVHAAHPLGLDAPIAGDRLYGVTTGSRMLLHAERIAFDHPHTGARLEIVSSMPF
jgi:tRNA pseudouridine32 synthase/23S rRNA pseudouridine746 synthase